MSPKNNVSCFSPFFLVFMCFLFLALIGLVRISPLLNRREDSDILFVGKGVVGVCIILPLSMIIAVVFVDIFQMKEFSSFYF